MDDFTWVREINPFQTGKHFSDGDICFNSNNTCQININKNDITFVIDFSDWSEWVRLDDDNSFYVESFLYNSTEYDGGGDYYEFDYDEFNYSGSYLTGEQIIRFQKILNILNNDQVQIDDFINDNMLDLMVVLKYYPLKIYFKSLIDNYLYQLGYVIQKNRWLSLGIGFEQKLKETGSSWDLYQNQQLEVIVPMNVVWDLYSKGVENLSDLLVKVSNPIVKTPWSDLFYDVFDNSGLNVDEIFDSFLDDAESFLEDKEVIKAWEKHYKMVNKLGFKNVLGWRENYYKRENPNNTRWYANFDYKNKKVDLELYDKIDNRWNTEPIKKFKVSFKDLPQYILNYSLNLESTK